jgi:hypothetical protein
MSIQRDRVVKRTLASTFVLHPQCAACPKDLQKWRIVEEVGRTRSNDKLEKIESQMAERQRLSRLDVRS